MVRGFTRWARALLLVLTPALGVLTMAPGTFDAGPIAIATWLVAVAWALGTTLCAPRIAELVMAPTAEGRRARCILLAVELPLAIALALTNPAWTAVVFAAGWTNWWQRLGPTEAIPDFSWRRAAVWAAVTASTQIAGLAIATSGALWPQAAVEATVTLVVVVLIADTYGAMLPVYVGVAAQILFTGARRQRDADADARRVLADVADAMRRAAEALGKLPDPSPADEDAREILLRESRRMVSAGGPPRRRGRRALGDVVTAALADGGYERWVGDPRAVAAAERAREEGRPEPVAVRRPEFASNDIADVAVPAKVARDLHDLLVTCIVESRVHGARMVQTIVRRDGDTIEVRIANMPNPEGSHSGGGHGGREIQRLARALPGGGDAIRELTDRSFIGAAGQGVLFGVRFTFTVGDTHARGEGARQTRPGV
jgi:hypothetical protein